MKGEALPLVPIRWDAQRLGNIPRSCLLTACAHLAPRQEWTRSGSQVE